MKRKFSFNLAPVVGASQPTPPQPPSVPPSHARHSSHSSLSDASPFINRRLLDPQTERELRCACKLILQNFKPSDHGIDDADPKLDFGAMARPREHRTKDRNAARFEPRVRMPTGAPVDLKTALEARGLQQTGLTRRAPGDALPAPAKSARKPTDFAWLDERNDKREANLRKSSSQSRSSRTLDPAAAADAQATEWMRQERDKQDSSHPQARPSTAVRSLSRSRSIRDNIREYVFPGTSSRTLSRAPSHGSLLTLNTNLSQDSPADPPLSASGHGWRSWALPRRSSSRSNSRPGTSKGQPEEKEQAPKTNAVNLNRELPPLPSLDSWKDAVQPPPEKAKSPTSAHIASLMRPQEQSTPEHNAAKNKSHRRTGSDTLAMQYSPSLAARSPTHHKHAAQSASRSKTLTPDSLTLGRPTLASASTSNLGHARQSSCSTSTPSKSGENRHSSRKMSVETPARSTFSNEVKVSRREEQKSRLKKVFSGWMTKKEKKDDWMQQIEKEGVKEGVLLPDGPTGAPVVRY
ncbi:hypothetical protein BDU57DRAFT_536965 [Ampelomyces quisqualis]|uniref:Uncharacterized protein n=1 Tax=Ampelomyces quisqualis TaxID=50730 RepID=A0A6A5QPB8_AMPQU|nr:hypothetical protein BDU57DRAFT_536965 [Ampelomyces quisqualis]